MVERVIKDQIDKLNRNQPIILNKIGRLIQGFFTDSFKNKGFTNESFEPWAEQRHNYGNSLMDRTGRLKNSIRYTINENEITITSDVDYASYLNDGTDKMVAREFIGESAILNNMIENIVDEYIEMLNN